ncbi:MAG: tyrosine-protein phosphatase [Dehalococcoidia bacterium]|jgi:protein-tyrosine phosphatase|nr:tyrosine-protein phosphatase [Dehalococcoidia bacterium]
MRWDFIRKVRLPEVRGALFLTSMPGRQRPLEGDVTRAAGLKISLFVSLSPWEEVEEKSPRYAEAIAQGTLPWPVEFFPIENGDVPRDLTAYRAFVRNLARRLQEGERVLLHCAGGLGRTGMVAMSVLLELGLPYEEAESRVLAAGSSPETPAQWELVRRQAAGEL